MLCIEYLVPAKSLTTVVVFIIQNKFTASQGIDHRVSERIFYYSKCIDGLSVKDTATSSYRSPSLLDLPSAICWLLLASGDEDKKNWEKERGYQRIPALGSALFLDLGAILNTSAGRYAREMILDFDFLTCQNTLLPLLISSCFSLDCLIEDQFKSKTKSRSEDISYLTGATQLWKKAHLYFWTAGFQGVQRYLEVFG